jgi:hypothetical protein
MFCCIWVYALCIIVLYMHKYSNRLFKIEHPTGASTASQ